jgi:hypothetical protein
MPGCIIHFGMHKTGSSSIQDSLSSHPDVEGFHYARLSKAGKGNASGPIQMAFLSNPGKHFKIKQLGLGNEELERKRNEALSALHRELAYASSKTVIISGEGVCNFAEAELAAFCNVIFQYTRNVKAVGYIRAPRSYMPSAFQQKLGMGKLEGLDMPGLFPRYQRRFEKFIKVLGRENVEFWLFDPKTFPGNCVVQDFCKRLLIPFPAHHIVRRNESLSLPAVQLLFAYRKFGPGIGNGRPALNSYALLLKQIAQVDGPALRFRDSLVSPLLSEHSQDIAWMEQQLGRPLPDSATTDERYTIGSEADLLDFTPEAIQWLNQNLNHGPTLRAGKRPPDPGQVAVMLHEFRNSLAARGVKDRATASRAPARLKPGNVVDVKQCVAAACHHIRVPNEIPEFLAGQLVKQAFELINKEIAGLQDGALTIPNLGTFRVRSTTGAGAEQTEDSHVSFKPSRIAPASVPGGN